RWHYDVDLCRTLAQTKAKRINTKSAYKKLAWLENELAALDLPESHPKGICHCDFHFSNVLFQNDQFAALLDFDDANYTFLQFDLVGLIDSWAWPHTDDALNMAEARRIAQTYMTCRPLSQMEQHHLFDVYKLSILFDCVWFFARGDADDFYEKRKIAFLKNVKGDLLNAKM
ncbi:MAG: phosphotransferase, partial [Anaerolineales bacterium]|nr:phosphotransferase [Anaerolineales bacterium]